MAVLPLTNLRRCKSGCGALAAIGLLVLCAEGCVRRTLTVNTTPQGAAVVLNDQHIGTSPVKTDFVWYGDYSVIIRKEGFETINTHYRLNPPWYQVPPFDLLAEAFMPFWIHDQQQMSFTLEPPKPVDKAELLKQAQEFRDRALFEGDNPATQPAPAATGPAK